MRHSFLLRAHHCHSIRCSTTTAPHVALPSGAIDVRHGSRHRRNRCCDHNRCHTTGAVDAIMIAIDSVRAFVRNAPSGHQYMLWHSPLHRSTALHPTILTSLSSRPLPPAPLDHPPIATFLICSTGKCDKVFYYAVKLHRMGYKLSV